MSNKKVVLTDIISSSSSKAKPVVKSIYDSKQKLNNMNENSKDFTAKDKVKMKRNSPGRVKDKTFQEGSGLTASKKANVDANNKRRGSQK